MIELLVAFIIFVVVVAIVVLGVRWLCSQFAVPDPIAKVILWVLGALALIVFLLRFVSPLVKSIPSAH